MQHRVPMKHTHPSRHQPLHLACIVLVRYADNIVAIRAAGGSPGHIDRDQVLVIAWGEQIALMNWAMACSGR